MQPFKQLSETLRALAGPEHCVFAPSDLAAAVPECGQLAVLLSRATKAGLLRRVCRGIYFNPVPGYPAGNLLFHAAARLRAGELLGLSGSSHRRASGRAQVNTTLVLQHGLQPPRRNQYASHTPRPLVPDSGYRGADLRKNEYQRVSG